MELSLPIIIGLPQVVLVVKSPLPMESSVPGLGRSPGGGNDNPLQYSCLENPMDRGVWRPLVHGVPGSDTIEQLSRHITERIQMRKSTRRVEISI